MSQFDFDYSNEFGWTTGLKAGLNFGKYFELNLGFQVEQVRVESGHNSEIEYDPNLENGDALNTYDLTLASPYGLTDASFILNRNRDIGSDEVPLEVDFFRVIG